MEPLMNGEGHRRNNQSSIINDEEWGETSGKGGRLLRRG
jgi:hypothetical protein